MRAWVFLLALLVCAAPAPASEEFPQPPELTPAVRFWADVFTRYSQRDLIIHDRLEPDRIYAVVSGPEAEDQAEVASRIRGILDHLALGTLHQPDAVDQLFRPEQRISDPPVGLDRIRLQRGMREGFRAGLLAARRLRPVLEAVLSREGLPLDLVALPLVESCYNPRATSAVGAAGIWQIMPATARQYLPGSGRAPHRDARRDPLQATVAAARLLRDLHAEFASWPLALTAYNHGATGVDRARRTLDTNDLGTIVRHYHGPRFGFASRNFYAEFLAARQISAYVGYYFPDLAPDRVIEYQVKRGDTLSAVARRHGVSLPRLRSLNALQGPRAHRLRPGDVLMIGL